MDRKIHINTFGLNVALALVLCFLFLVCAKFSVSAWKEKPDFEGASKAYAEAVREGKTQVDLGDYNIPEEKIAFLINYSSTHNADIFWYPASVEYAAYQKGKCIATMSWENSFEDISEIEEMKKDFEKYSREAINVCFNRDMTDLERIISAHDYLTEMCVYHLEDDYSYTAYSIFVRNEGVCQGYAYAFKYLMDAVGIECYVVSSNEINHAWNVVKLDGEYYMVDVTENDGKAYYNTVEIKHGMSTHQKLLCSDEAFACEAKDVVVYSLEESIQCVSKKYDDAFFKSVRGSMEYINGYWYYVEPNKYLNGSTKILKTSSDFSKTEVFYEASKPVYAVAKHGKNLYCAVKDKVLVISQDGKEKEVCSTVGEIFGLCVKENNLIYGVYRKKSYAVCNKIIPKNLDFIEGINLDVSMDSVSVNVYVKDYIELDNESVDYFMGVSDTQKTTVKFENIENGMISIPVDYLKLNEGVSVSIKTEEGEETYFISLANYFSSILEGEYDEKTKNLVKALLSYSGMYEDSEIELPNCPKVVVWDNSDEISYSGIEIEVGKTVNVKIDFSVIGTAEFTVNGRYEAKKNGLHYSVCIPDISFVNFEDEFIIRAKDISFRFSVLGLLENCEAETRERVISFYEFGKALSSF